MRGRTVIVASLWMGRPILLISIVTIAAWRPPGAGSTFLTSPTWTPAIRTNDAVFRRFAVGTAALIVNVGLNGMLFVSPKYMTGMRMSSAISPTLKVEAPLGRFRLVRLLIA